MKITPAELYSKTRELRVFIAKHPDCLASEIPEDLRRFISFACKKKTISWKGNERRFYIRPMEVLTPTRALVFKP